MRRRLDRLRHSPRGARRTAGSALALAAALLLAGCAGDPDPIELVVEPASFDVAVGDDQRLLVGLFTPERQLVAHGEVELGLAYLGDDGEAQAPIEQTAPARFVSVPGTTPGDTTEQPSLVEDTGTGVYAATVDLDRPGLWGVRIVGELEDGTPISGNRVLQVLEEHLVPAPGDEAPQVDNHTLADVEAGDVEAIAVDSRAQGPNDEVAHPQLHRTTVAEAIGAGRPVVVAIATPVYCATRFCGPLTDVVAELATTYDDRAEFVHIEVWEDFDEQRLNDAAAAFIQTESGGNEPWVFLIDADGRIADRWDNILDLDELTDALEALPTLPDAGVADG